MVLLLSSYTHLYHCTGSALVTFFLLLVNYIATACIHEIVYALDEIFV